MARFTLFSFTHIFYEVFLFFLTQRVELTSSSKDVVKKDDVKSFFMTMMRFLAKEPPLKKKEEDQGVSQENLMNMFTKIMF